MNVTELTADQLAELKGNYIVEMENNGKIVAEEDIVLDEIILYYEGTSFVNDDFFCSMDN